MLQLAMPMANVLLHNSEFVFYTRRTAFRSNSTEDPPLCMRLPRLDAYCGTASCREFSPVPCQLP